MRKNDLYLIKQHLSGALLTEFGAPLIEVQSSRVETVTTYTYPCGVSINKVEALFQGVVVETKYYA